MVRIIEGSPEAAVMHDAVPAAHLVLAPELMLTEVEKALWRRQRSGQLEASGLQHRLNSAMNLVDYIEPNRTLFICSQGSHVANCKPPMVYKHLIKSSNSLRSKLYISLQK